MVGLGGYAGSSGGCKAFTVAHQILSALGFGVVNISELELEEKQKNELRKHNQMIGEMKKSVDF